MRGKAQKVYVVFNCCLGHFEAYVAVMAIKDEQPMCLGVFRLCHRNEHLNEPVIKNMLLHPARVSGSKKSFIITPNCPLIPQVLYFVDCQSWQISAKGITAKQDRKLF